MYAEYSSPELSIAYSKSRSSPYRTSVALFIFPDVRRKLSRSSSPLLTAPTGQRNRMLRASCTAVSCFELTSRSTETICAVRGWYGSSSFSSASAMRQSSQHSAQISSAASSFIPQSSISSRISSADANGPFCTDRHSHRRSNGRPRSTQSRAAAYTVAAALKYSRIAAGQDADSSSAHSSASPPMARQTPSTRLAVTLRRLL